MLGRTWSAWLAFAGAVFAIAAARGLRAQHSDGVRGHAYGPDSASPIGAAVIATGQYGGAARSECADAPGSFLVASDRTLEFASQSRAIHRDEGSIDLPSVDFRLARAAQYSRADPLTTPALGLRPDQNVVTMNVLTVTGEGVPGGSIFTTLIESLSPTDPTDLRDPVGAAAHRDSIPARLWRKWAEKKVLNTEP